MSKVIKEIANLILYNLTFGMSVLASTKHLR